MDYPGHCSFFSLIQILVKMGRYTSAIQVVSSRDALSSMCSMNARQFSEFVYVFKDQKEYLFLGFIVGTEVTNDVISYKTAS